MKFNILATVVAALFAASAEVSDAQKKIDYGADKVNQLGTTAGTILGGRDDYDYLALKDHIGPSGVPLGGIGVGYFDYAPNGRFTRLQINNWHGSEQSPVIHDALGTFLALWQNGKARLLQRQSSYYAGMSPSQHTVYRGLFPIAECRIDSSVKVRAYSGLVPHNVRDSSLPTAWIEVSVTNPGGQSAETAVAFSWQDLLARGILDVPDRELLSRFGNTAWDRGEAEQAAAKEGKRFWVDVPRVPTNASAVRVGNLAGICQQCEPLHPVLRTYQNLNNRIAILAEQQPGAEVSYLPAYSVTSPDDAWASFRKNGRFGPAVGTTTILHSPSDATERASAIALRASLKPGETRTFRFLVAWYAPEAEGPGLEDQIHFGTADYSRYYHRSFHDLESLVGYAAQNRQRIYNETVAWQAPILNSTYPDWLKFKLINSAYTLYTNTILNEAGDFTVMEGGMGGLAGTMDQRISAHPLYQKLFPELDRSELELFGHTPGAQGQIMHFDGHYYWGMAARTGVSSTPDNWMVDNTGGWLLQLARYWQQTGDTAWIKQFQKQIEGASTFLESQIRSSKYHIVTGPTTYDDFWHPDLYAYNATTYPSFLQAAGMLFEALGNPHRAGDCREDAQLAANDAIRALWNGRYFAYGADLNGANRRDDIMFSGQLAGQFLSRVSGWRGPFSQEMVSASIVAQLKTNVTASTDLYAPKVWNIKEGRAMLDPRRPGEQNTDSTCWPYYLESYTAMAAIQAGYVDDGLEIMRHIQLVHLRNGWTWTQSLWRPGELTYMTAPVTWFITDVLAGSSLNASTGTLSLSPIVRAHENRVDLPIYSSQFWATLTVERKARTVKLRILRTFGSKLPVIKLIEVRPVGTNIDFHFDIPPFLVREGSTLDLSEHFNTLTAGSINASVLANIKASTFLEFHPHIITPPVISPVDTSFVDKTTVGLQTENPAEQIRYTLDGSSPLRFGKLYNGPITISASTTVKAITGNPGKTWSAISRRQFSEVPYRKPDLPDAAPTGKWRWRYYEGNWDKLPDFAQLMPAATGESDTLNLDMRKRDLYFGLIFEGAIRIERKGIYTFRLNSDDGSRLIVGGEDVLDADGVHDPLREYTLTKPLLPGVYSLKLLYFQKEGGSELKLRVTEQVPGLLRSAH